MYAQRPAEFDYKRPATLDEAIGLLAENGDARPLAGGHSLLPLMKLRLADPQALVDIGRLPGLDGIAFYHKLRQSSVGAEIPVLFISGLSSTESRLKHLTQGDFGYIAKPYNLASLVLSVTTMLLKTRLKVVSATQ